MVFTLYLSTCASPCLSLSLCLCGSLRVCDFLIKSTMTCGPVCCSLFPLSAELGASAGRAAADAKMARRHQPSSFLLGAVAVTWAKNSPRSQEWWAGADKLQLLSGHPRWASSRCWDVKGAPQPPLAPAPLPRLLAEPPRLLCGTLGAVGPEFESRCQCFLAV